MQKRQPTKRAPDAGDSAHIPSIFTRLIIFPVGRLRRPRPSAGNANRWALTPKKTQTGFSKMKQFALLLGKIFVYMSISFGLAMSKLLKVSE